ncbi:hypothetical protein [Rhizosphaericola mali]|uniref:Uncharacterized protein n=1 Tax=Rhizosphaericola mali TaxID=2545455 RepID=A0A5P2G6B4_9BACT|nr:hypothetical protein [Rhizosphaericola mali]QES88753.1 hypothetical protein E0W69_008850 [Rhizosphaericola mali]
MAKEKILITVKTYPNLSAKYDELVCTAGFREDGTWIRIFPIPFRKLEDGDKYHKYDWYIMDVTKNPKDQRPESYRPNLDVPFEHIGSLGTEGNWLKRKEIVLKNKHYTNMEQLIADAYDKDKFTSLAVFKPTEILDFIIEPDERVWNPEKLKAVIEKDKQTNLFKETGNPFKVVDKLPYKFSYKFKDETGKVRTLMIEDWETGMLYFNCLKKFDGYDREALACEQVRQKYFDDFAKTKDLYFFLGTSYKFHMQKAHNPFIIIGTFSPKRESQLALF